MIVSMRVSFSAYHYECDSDIIDYLWSIAMRGIFSDLLVLLDIPVKLCQAILRVGVIHQIQDTKPSSYHESVRERYLSFVSAYEKRGLTLTLNGTLHRNIQLHNVRKAIREFNPVVE